MPSGRRPPSAGPSSGPAPAPDVGPLARLLHRVAPRAPRRRSRPCPQPPRQRLDVEGERAGSRRGPVRVLRAEVDRLALHPAGLPAGIASPLPRLVLRFQPQAASSPPADCHPGPPGTPGRWPGRRRAGGGAVDRVAVPMVLRLVPGRPGSGPRDQMSELAPLPGRRSPRPPGRTEELLEPTTRSATISGVRWCRRRRRSSARSLRPRGRSGRAVGPAHRVAWGDPAEEAGHRLARTARPRRRRRSGVSTPGSSVPTMPVRGSLATILRISVRPTAAWSPPGGPASAVTMSVPRGYFGLWSVPSTRARSRPRRSTALRSSRAALASYSCGRSPPAGGNRRSGTGRPWPHRPGSPGRCRC